MSKEIKNRSIGLVVTDDFFEKVRKRAESQKRSFGQIARLLMEKAIEAEDDLQKRMYGKDVLDPEDIKDIKYTQIDFDDFMKDWLESKEINEDK